MKKYIGKYKKEGLPGGPNEVETTINGFIITNEGQWKYPGQPTLIPSNEITMQGVGFPVLGIDDTGHSKMMMPGADYTFPGSMVYELPMAQSGKTVSQNWQEVTGTPWSKAKELGLTTGGADQNVELRKKFLANPEYYRNLAQGRQDVATVEPISVEQIYQPIASSISREDVPVQDQYRNVRQQEPENIIGRYNITPYGVEAAPYTISDPRLLQLPTMVTDFENDTEGSFIGEGSWNRLGAVPLTSATGEFAQEYFDPLTGEATGEFIPTLASSTLTASGPNAYMPEGSFCAQKECAAGMQYNIVGHLEGGWDELKDKLGIRGDAWTINENILNSGGQRIYGLGTDMDINRSKKYSSNEVRKKLYEARKKHNLDAVYESAQVGDIVEMYYPNSSSQEEAIRTGKGDTYTTHVGHITEKDGVKYVTHNVDGTFHTDKLDTLLRRSGSRGSTKGTTVSGIIRPNYGWRDSQNGAVSISKKPVQAIAASGDRNYYTTEDQEKVSDWQLAAITPVAKQFVQGLESVAPDIAADFGLSNDQLSLIMKASFGAFGNESGFGQSNTYKKKERARRVIRGYKNIAPEWMPEGDEQSEGLSQIKLENAFNDPKAKALLKKYGIKDVEQLYDPMYSSIATMLLTAMNYKQFESATGLKAEDVDPITMQNIMLLAHNKGMQNVINNDFVEEGKFKKLHQLRRKGHKYVEGEEPKLSDQSILQGLATYADVHMNPDSYTNKTGDFAASLNIDMSRLFAEKGDREAYVGQEAPEAYGLGETLLDQAYGLLGDSDYSDDKEKLLAAMESAKIKAIKNAEKLYKGSKQKLRRALSQIERDSRKAINEIQNAGEKAVNRVRSTFEEGGDVSSKIYIGQYTMGPNKDLDNVEFKNGGLVKYQPGGSNTAQSGRYSHRDSVDHQADKILQYEQLKGGPGGAPLPSYSNPKYKSMIMDHILPEVDKIMPTASAMEKSEAIDFIFNAGWDKYNNTIKKDPRAYAIQEYYRKFDPSKLDKDGKWAGRKNAPYSFDQEYDNTIGKLSENERRILMNKGRDWYYQNINNPSPGVPSSDYYDTWYGRIHNTNDFSPFNPNNRNLTHPSRRENGGLIKYQTAGEKLPPLYVDRNDPAGRARYEAYQDSSSLYNRGEEKLKYWRNNPNATNSELNRAEDEIDKRFPVSTSRGSFGVNVIGTIGMQPIGSGSALRHVPLYKKPVEPVEYEDISVEKIKPNSNQIPERNLAPVAPAHVSQKRFPDRPYYTTDNKGNKIIAGVDVWDEKRKSWKRTMFDQEKQEPPMIDLGSFQFQSGGPTDPPKKPPLTSSDFDYTTDRSRGNARFFSDPVTGEPFPLVNLPEVEIVETLNRDENGNIIFSSPEARDNYFAYKNLGEQGLRDMQAMKSGIRGTTGNFANTFLVPPAMVAGTVLGGAPLVGPVARGASFLNTALQAPMQFGSRTIPGVTGYNFLGALGAGESINQFANPSSTTRQSIGRAIQDPTTGNILDASGNTLVSGLGFVGIGAAPAMGPQLSRLAKDAGKILTAQTPLGRNAAFPRTSSELTGTGFQTNPYYHFDTFASKRAEIAEHLKTPEGRARLQNYIDNNPHLQQLNKSVDNVISDFEATDFITERPYFDKSKKEWIRNDDGSLRYFPVDPNNAFNWYMRGSKQPSSVSMGQNFTPYDAEHILEHEFAHLFQRGEEIAGVDDVLANISLRQNPMDRSIAELLNKYNPFGKTKDSGYSVSNKLYGAGNNAWHKQKNYWLTGDDRGQEKAAFAAEIRENLLQRGLLKNRYDEITPELLEKHYELYNKTGGDKYNLRLYEIMKNDKNNFKLLSKALNRMPAVLPAAVGVGATAAALAGSEPRQIIPPDFRYGGFVKYPNGDEQLLTAQFGGMRRGKVDRILDDNRDLNFVDRMYQPNTPSIMIPGQDSPSTHFMESADGRVYPTVVQMPDGSLQYLGANAYDYAMETGEYIEFPNDRQARRFAKSYKKGTGVLDEFSSGGLKQWFAENWIDIKTGKKCGRGKDETGRP